VYYRVDTNPTIRHNSCHHYVTLSLPQRLAKELLGEQIGTCDLDRLPVVPIEVVEAIEARARHPRYADKEQEQVAVCADLGGVCACRDPEEVVSYLLQGKWENQTLEEALDLVQRQGHGGYLLALQGEVIGSAQLGVSGELCWDGVVVEHPRVIWALPLIEGLRRALKEEG
jgi:hypothetical protein